MKCLTLFTCCCIFLLLPCIISAQVDENSKPRFALIIGNSTYQYTSPLRNPANDATDVAASLSRAGFTVDLLTNADLSTMGDALYRFGKLLEKDQEGAGFFFYAGHGIQSGGENYLLPVDQNIANEAQLKRKAISLSELLSYMDDAGNSFNMVVLDACRNNPFASSFRSASRGLAVLGSAPPETVVLYSTGAGDVAEDGGGRNSPFTAALLNHLQTPRIEVETLLRETTGEVRSSTGMRQIPYRYSNITRPFYFLPPDAPGYAGSGAPNKAVAPSADNLQLSVSAAAEPLSKDLQNLQIEFNRGTILWKGKYYQPGFFSGYGDFLKSLEKAPEINKSIQIEIDRYRGLKRTSSLLQWGGLTLMGLMAMTSSGNEGELSDDQIALGYAGIIGGVAMSAIGMIIGGTPPKKLINTYNEAGFTIQSAGSAGGSERSDESR